MYHLESSIKLASLIIGSSYSVHGPGSLIGTPDKAEHVRKKRIFIQGFSDSAIREHEPKVYTYINQFCDMLLDATVTDDGWTSSKNLTRLCKYYDLIMHLND